MQAPDYPAMVATLMQLAMGKKYLDLPVVSKPRPGTIAKNQDKVNAARDKIKAWLNSQQPPVVPILPDDPNAQ